MGQKKVLIVDDDIDFAESLSENLNLKGFEAEIVHSAKEALNRIEQVAYQAIIMDIVMPGLDGVDCLEKIHGIKPKVPVWMMTGYSLSERMKKAMNHGAKGIFSKPIRVPDLLSELSDLPCIPC